jgi:hypothetical protein
MTVRNLDRRFEPASVELFTPIRELTHEMTTGLTKIDYDREMALVLAEHDRPARSSAMCCARTAACWPSAGCSALRRRLTLTIVDQARPASAMSLAYRRNEPYRVA